MVKGAGPRVVFQGAEHGVDWTGRSAHLVVVHVVDQSHAAGAVADEVIALATHRLHLHRDKRRPRCSRRGWYYRSSAVPLVL